MTAPYARMTESTPCILMIRLLSDAIVWVNATVNQTTEASLDTLQEGGGGGGQEKKNYGLWLLLILGVGWLLLPLGLFLRRRAIRKRLESVQATLPHHGEQLQPQDQVNCDITKQPDSFYLSHLQLRNRIADELEPTTFVSERRERGGLCLFSLRWTLFIFSFLPLFACVNSASDLL